MSRTGIFLAAAMCLALLSPAPLAAKMVTYWYQPHYMATIEDARNQMQFLSPHFAPIDLGPNIFTVTSGYSLVKVSENELGINLFFTTSGMEKQSTGGLFSSNSVMVPYQKNIVTSIPYARIAYFKILTFPGAVPPSWCVAPIVTNGPTNDVLCLPTQTEAQELADALATLAVGSGTTLSDSYGMTLQPMTEKALRKHPERTGCQIEEVYLDGPAAQAGIRESDILHTVNGLACTPDVMDAAVAAATAKPGDGAVRTEILRNGNTMTVDLRFPHTEVNAAALRQQMADLFKPNAAPPSAAPSSAPAPGGVHLGIHVRAVTDADVAPMGLANARGIVVVDVEKGSLAEKMGLQEGDVILEVNNSEIGDVQLFIQYVQSGAVKKFRIWRKGQALELTVPQSL